MSFEVCEPLYSANLLSPAKKNINQGGTSSAKTYTIMQVLFIIACQEPASIITVVGQDVPNLKKGAIRDAAKIVASSVYLQNQVHDYKNTKGYNKTERIYELKNGSIIEFNSYDNEQDAKSGKRDYLFINEANGISYDIYFQLSIRTRQKEFLDYNPSAKFWVHEKLIGRPEVALFITDHRHNRFLSKEQHEEIENIPDKELWNVYARGRTGQIHGVIYPGYKIIESMPDLIKPAYGLDFGFNHKTALIETMEWNNDLYWNQLIYQTELTMGDLIPMMKELELGNAPIYCDHAAPDKIEELRRAKFNALKADKDVKNGIDYVKRHNLYLTKRSYGLRKEIQSYKYKVKDGETIDEPVKFMDDGMDAGRYGSYSFRHDKGIKIAKEEEEYTEEQENLSWIQPGYGMTGKLRAIYNKILAA